MEKPPSGGFFTNYEIGTIVGPTITKEQYQMAYRSFSRYARLMCDTLNQEYSHLEFRFDPGVGTSVAIAAYDDIDRYKSYHLRNKRPQDRARSDVVKRAAYFTKWIVKLRPIMTVRSEKLKISEDVSPLVNESIAIGYAITLIKAECGKYFRLTDKAYFELQYDLHFRPMGEDALVAAYQIIVDLVKAGTDNAIVVFNSNPSD